jgi:alkanesulfonate monooxygenase SsuD/methylene tetrahydromethanopterin reductase-like flavin-dependent oxidoreductase (luciferase family)
VAPQLVVSMADTHEKAVRRFQDSQVFAHLSSLSGSTLKDQRAGGMEGRNLIGTPEQIRERVAAYADAGANTLSALLFASGTVEETLDAMEAFAEEVIAPCADEVLR